MIKDLKPINFRKIKNETGEVEKFCNNDTCQLK